MGGSVDVHLGTVYHGLLCIMKPAGSSSARSKQVMVQQNDVVGGAMCRLCVCASVVACVVCTLLVVCMCEGTPHQVMSL